MALGEKAGYLPLVTIFPDLLSILEVMTMVFARTFGRFHATVSCRCKSFGTETSIHTFMVTYTRSKTAHQWTLLHTFVMNMSICTIASCKE